MFGTLFRYPAVVAWHRSGPLAEARERFLNHCASLCGVQNHRLVDSNACYPLAATYFWRPHIAMCSSTLCALAAPARVCAGLCQERAAARCCIEDEGRSFGAGL
jgi:hypothetical protein